MRFYQCAATSRGTMVERVTLRQAVAESRCNNRGGARLIVAAADEREARRVCGAYGQAADNGMAGHGFAVEIRGPGRGVFVISEAGEARP